MTYSKYLSAVGLTSPATSNRSILTGRVSEASAIVPGVYGNGPLTLLDDRWPVAPLADWSWLVPEAAIAFAATAFGDVFFYKPGRGVHLLEVQGANVEFVDSELLYVVNEFLATPLIVDKVLRAEHVKALVAASRPISYGEVFILRPWEVLGGDRSTGAYDIGRLDVYLSLVGQTLQQILKAE